MKHTFIHYDIHMHTVNGAMRGGVCLARSLLDMVHFAVWSAQELALLQLKLYGNADPLLTVAQTPF